VSILGALYLLAMLLNIVLPSGLTSPRASLFNYDWITLVVMLALLIIGGIYFLIARPHRATTERTSEWLANKS
jgi:hypothetical protein